MNKPKLKRERTQWQFLERLTTFRRFTFDTELTPAQCEIRLPQLQGKYEVKILESDWNLLKFQMGEQDTGVYPTALLIRIDREANFIYSQVTGGIRVLSTPDIVGLSALFALIIGSLYVLNEIGLVNVIGATEVGALFIVVSCICSFFVLVATIYLMISSVANAPRPYHSVIDDLKRVFEVENVD
jgi:hypothetical protein